VPIFQISLLGLIGLTFSAVMSSQWIGRGYFTLLSALSIGVALTHICVSLWLVPRLGMYGAVYANLTTHTISIVGNGIFALRCERNYRRRQAIAPEAEAA
jgi:O-antigen/teichoic acid export membrane protein